MRSLALPRPASAVISVGPEGGWAEEEVARARRAGFRPTTLGRHTLRAEAVPVAALSVLRFVWQDDEDPPGAFCGAPPPPVEPAGRESAP